MYVGFYQCEWRRQIPCSTLQETNDHLKILHEINENTAFNFAIQTERSEHNMKHVTQKDLLLYHQMPDSLCSCHYREETRGASVLQSLTHMCMHIPSFLNKSLLYMVKVGSKQLTCLDLAEREGYNQHSHTLRTCT